MSFDDQYNGCVGTMEDKVEDLQHTEFANRNYANVWDRSTTVWNKMQPQGLQQNYAIAILAYTQSKGSLFRELNREVQIAGQSEDYYLKNFQFKSFHFLVTRALQLLRANANGKCYTTYRGVSGIKFTTERSRKVRFGYFASSSLEEKVAMGFGDHTFFTIKTCHGAYIKDFSIFRDEEEVLIPPYELFQVEEYVRTSSGKIRIRLTSVGKWSKYNCVYATGNNNGALTWPAPSC